jgi:multiple sugar transport system substrate-binding protein
VAHSGEGGIFGIVFSDSVAKFQELTGANVTIEYLHSSELYGNMLSSDNWDIGSGFSNFVTDTHDPIVQRMHPVPHAYLASKPYQRVASAGRAKTISAGRQYAWPAVDGDSLSLCYRSDVLEDPTWQAQYKADTGKDLPVPPRTWKEYTDVALYFTGKDWNGAGDGLTYGTSDITNPDDLLDQMIYARVSQYLPLDHKGDVVFGKSDGETGIEVLVDTAMWKQALQEWVDTVPAMYPGWRTTGLGGQIWGNASIYANNTLMSYSWDDVPIATASTTNISFKVAQIPVGDAVWDAATDTMVSGTLPPPRPYHVWGWSTFVNRNSANADAAFDYLCYASNAERRTVFFGMPGSGINPAGLMDLSEEYFSYFDGDGSRPGAKETYLATKRAQYDGSLQPTMVVRHPLLFTVQAIVKTHSFAALNGTKTVDEALHDAKAAIEAAVAAEAGMEARIRAYLDEHYP